MRILVTGSRDWTDRLTIYRVLDGICSEFGLYYEPDEFGNTLPNPAKIAIIHGACPTGADAIADDWCLGNNFVAETYPAEWNKFGKRAAYLRNKEMVDRGADLCVGFRTSPNSRGTNMTMDLANAAEIEVRIYE